MTDLLITNARDTWVNSQRTGNNYGSTNVVRVQAGTDEKRGLLRPEITSFLGRTVTEARLVGHAADALVAQTFTLSPLAARFTSGQAKWSNQPGVTAATPATVTIGALAQDDEVEWDVTDHMQAVADGTPFYGWRLETDSTTAQQKFRSNDSGEPAWELHITLSDAPEIPSDLRPDGGGAVGSVTPMLAWEYVDLGGDLTEQSEAWIQFDTPVGGAEPDEVAPDFDSGWVAPHTEPVYDMATSGHTPVGAGPHYWRVNVRDADGNESGFSDWAEFTVAALPTLVIDSPTGPFGDVTPQLLAHLSSGTVKQWKAHATGTDRSDVRAETGLMTGAIDWTVPERSGPAWGPAIVGVAGRRVIREDELGWIYLRVWDDVDRTVAVGEKTYVDVWIEAEFDDDLGLGAPTDLTVTPIAPGDPRRLWSWSRTEAADAWLIQVDGVTVARLEPEDVTVDAGTYSWTDLGTVPPLRPHTLAVRAVEAGAGRSTAATYADPGEELHAVWLIPEADGIDPVALSGTAVSSFERKDHTATYVTHEGDEVDIIYGTPPRTGRFEGQVHSGSPQDVWTSLDQLELLRKSRNRMAQLVWGSKSVRARIRDVDATPADEILPGNLLHAVRFGFVEVDDA